MAAAATCCCCCGVAIMPACAAAARCAVNKAGLYMLANEVAGAEADWTDDVESNVGRNGCTSEGDVALASVSVGDGADSCEGGKSDVANSDARLGDSYTGA